MPHLARIDEVPENDWQPLPKAGAGQGRFQIGAAIKDFYLTNPIARSSELMAELSANAKARGARSPMAAE